jgi:hypothetical protein
MDEMDWVATIGVLALVIMVVYMVIVCMFVPFL